MVELDEYIEEDSRTRSLSEDKAQDDKYGKFVMPIYPKIMNRVNHDENKAPIEESKCDVAHKVPVYENS